MKKVKKILFTLLLTIMLLPCTILAYSKYLIPGGENVAIEVNWAGVLVVGLYDIDGVSPALDAGLKIGDMITKVNDETINTIDELIEKINNSNSNIIDITYLRKNKEYTTKLTLINNEGVLKTGLYIKDSITGIGTLTYIDPNTKLYGALGHEIIESNTGIMLEISNGNIYNSEVINIERSENGNPGSKVANLKFNDSKGTIYENTDKGIFGIYTSNLPDKKTFEVATIDDIKLGDASIYTVVSGNEVKEYKIKILKINKNDTKNILFEIVDEELLNATGGVVQGMSGSPIIQGKYIVGAVTHVVVDNPNKGYGILITNMLEEAEN